MNAGTITYDAAIVGAGPAGVSCAVWLARLGLRPVLLESGNAVGGLCRSHPFADEWNVSLPGATGPEVAANLAKSLKQAGVDTRLSSRVERVDAMVLAADTLASGFELRVAGLPDPLYARHLVLATGVRARALAQAENTALQTGQTGHCPGGISAGTADVPQTDGILTGPGSHVVAQDFRNKNIAVLGGGDNAFENALYALEHGARSVRLFARTVRAQRQFVRQFPPDAVIVGDYAVDAQARTVNGEPYDLIMVFYGWEPCTRFAATLNLRRSARGFIATDQATAQTSFPGVYAIGEVSQRQHPCVVTALADGVTAAKAIQARVEAGR